MVRRLVRITALASFTILPLLPLAASATGTGTNGRLIGSFLGGYVTMKSDGSNPHQLAATPFVNNGESSRAAYSVSGSKIAYPGRTDSNQGDTDIYLASPDGSNATALTSGATDDVEPHFSPDGTKIAFVRNTSGDAEVYVVNVDGSGILARTSSAGTSGGGDATNGLTWSADGTKIVYIGADGGIYEVNATGAIDAGETQLHAPATGNATISGVDVSPAGTTVLFTENADTGGNTSVMSFPIGGGADTTLIGTTDGSYKLSPVYSPDGTKFAFVETPGIDSVSAVNASDLNYIVVANADGSNANNVYTVSSDSDNKALGSLKGVDWGGDQASYSTTGFTNQLSNGSNPGLPNAGALKPVLPLALGFTGLLAVVGVELTRRARRRDV